MRFEEGGVWGDKRAKAKDKSQQAWGCVPSVVFASLLSLSPVMENPREPTVDLAGLIGHATGTG